MRAIILVLSIVSALIVLSVGVAQAQDTTSVTVKRVIDGDTIEISPTIDGIEIVRLIGVDTPETVDPGEPVEPFGPQASRFVTRQLEGERVTLVFGQERVDQFDRLLAYVRLNGSSFNETLLRQGYAQLYIVPPNDRFEARFRQAQQQARSANRGLWGLPPNQLCQLADRGNSIGGGCSGSTNGTTTGRTTTGRTTTGRTATEQTTSERTTSERTTGERRVGGREIEQGQREPSQRERGQRGLMESGGRLPDTGGFTLLPITGGLLVAGALGISLLWRR